ncbi:hypothetical protein L249_0877 [Ophiocordyceps polyrhachis-furcata BCC 54312]|uniref:Heme haloperoxidase family profile domain-containing protein n=1 Tax=Ophiocordyceps polyrhachis-furcata BCC 54312 TaxID=1330021 RepID=A0A367LE25_9HYPO|nr:hypothetical protein L249_0877 [Ophiocordyceps polyrhachis-furcata BCC 54312]
MKAAFFASLLASVASTGSAAYDAAKSNSTDDYMSQHQYAHDKAYVHGHKGQGMTYGQGRKYVKGATYAQGMRYVQGASHGQDLKYVHGSKYAHRKYEAQAGGKSDGKSQHCVLTLIFQIPYIGDKLQLDKGSEKPVKSEKQCWWINKPADGYSPSSSDQTTSYTAPAKFQPNGKEYMNQNSPKIDPNDPRFNEFMARKPGESRSSCPGLNALANHNFIPRSGRNLTMTDLVVGCYEGLGISPETAALISADGLSEAQLPYDTVFNLEDFHSQRYGIEHDVSFGRNDTGKGDLTTLDDAAWDVVLKVLDTCGYGEPSCWAKAKVARIHHEQKRNPDTDYDKEAAAYGAAEVGMLLGAFDPSVKRSQTKECIKSLFEEEKIVCKPDRISAEFDRVTATGVKVLASDEYLQDASDGKVVSAQDILANTGKGKIEVEKVAEVLRAAGFTDQKAFDTLDRLIAEGKKAEEKGKQPPVGY